MNIRLYVQDVYNLICLEYEFPSQANTKEKMVNIAGICHKLSNKIDFRKEFYAASTN